MPATPPFEPRSPFETAFRAALEGADAYRAVRAGLRLHDEILRIGNRFVPLARFREIGLVAIGNAAGSMALAVQEMLGEALTQGLVAGAVPPPDSLQFQFTPVTDAWPGSTAADGARAQVLDLASGLRPEDLLLVLLSPGALAVAAGPPSGWDSSTWRNLLTSVAARSGGVAAARVARVLGTGLSGGRLGAAVRDPTVVTLVVDRGEGAESVGGGPTVPLSPGELSAVRPLVAGTSATALPAAPVGPLGANVHRPVVVTGPADAIEAAGNLLAGQGWISRMAALHLPGSPQVAASSFVAAIETIRRDQVAEPLSRSGVDSGASSERPLPSIPVPTTETPAARPESRGIAVFAGASFDTIEGGEGSENIEDFLRAAAKEAVRREAYVGALRTAGPVPGQGPLSGAWIGRRADPENTPVPPIESMALRAGITDVGTVLVAFVPWGAR